MGSFFKTCAITGITITDNEPCYVTRLHRNEHVYRHGPQIMKVDQEFQPISFPQLTKYYDYGMVDTKFKPNKLNEFLGLSVECDGEDVIKDEYFGDYRISVNLFLVHKQVYETLSTKFLDQDTFFHYRRAIAEEGPQYFIDGFQYLKEYVAEKGEAGFWTLGMRAESKQLFGWKTSNIGYIILNKIMEEQSFDILDELVTEGLAVELYKQFVFEQNMDVLWKYYTPSNYGGQFDNYNAYNELADIVKEVVDYKKKMWDDYSDEDYQEDEL